jgi:hypothetical protein
MMDNASALPTCPQRQRQEKTAFRKWPKSPTRLHEEAKLMALRDASVDARRKAALGLDMGDPSSLETLTRTHILIMALDAVIDELPPDADVEALIG